MTATVITGSKLEIAQKIADPEGDVREAIVFVQEWVEARRAEAAAAAPNADDPFAEMEPYMVHVRGRGRFAPGALHAAGK